MRRLLPLLLMVLVLGSTVHASASSFTVSCSYTRSLPDDPIVFPGQPGASHLHDFFGNRTTDAYSTYASMAGQPTSCGNTNDRAGYWVPALYVNGVKVNPSALKAYYYRRTSGTLTVPPPGLAMIGGDSHATGPQSTSRVYFGCGSGSGLAKVSYLPDCSTVGGRFAVHVSFPYCLTNGVASYPPCSGAAMPQLIERIAYPIIDARNVTLSSGAYFTYHADFFQTWDQSELARLVATL